jgi:hypothetical protein
MERQPRLITAIRVMWLVTVVVFSVSLGAFMGKTNPNVWTPSNPWSWGLIFVFYWLSGWCLIPAPFVAVAIAMEIIYRRRNPDARIHPLLKIVAWIVGIMIL